MTCGVWVQCLGSVDVSGPDWFRGTLQSPSVPFGDWASENQAVPGAPKAGIEDKHTKR